MTATDEQSTLRESILSSLLGLVIGVSIVIVLRVFIEIIKRCAKRQHGPDVTTGIEPESHTPDTPSDLLATNTRLPAITTVKTKPGHALSDMDRNIKLQSVNCQELQDLEAAIPRKHQ